MKKIVYNINVLFALIILLGSCANNDIEPYNGPSQIHFIEMSSNELVDDTNPVFIVEVGVTKAVDQDRTFDVVVDSDVSSAIEGVNFELLTPNVTIAAGEVIAEVQVKGLFESAEPEGVLLRLNLAAGNTIDVASFRNSYDLMLFKQCDFNRDAFIGRYTVYEHSIFGEFEYEVNATAGPDDYSIYIDGFWGEQNTAVQIMFNPRDGFCSVPNQFFYTDPENEPQYQNYWVRSTNPGVYNACLGSIEGIEYHVYPEDQLNSYWDIGTFDMQKIEE